MPSFMTVKSQMPELGLEGGAFLSPVKTRVKSSFKSLDLNNSGTRKNVKNS